MLDHERAILIAEIDPTTVTINGAKFHPLWDHFVKWSSEQPSSGTNADLLWSAFSQGYSLGRKIERQLRMG